MLHYVQVTVPFRAVDDHEHDDAGPTDRLVEVKCSTKLTARVRVQASVQCDLIKTTDRRNESL